MFLCPIANYHQMTPQRLLHGYKGTAFIARSRYGRFYSTRYTPELNFPLPDTFLRMVGESSRVQSIFPIRAPHRLPLMDRTERTNVHFGGVGAVSFEIKAKHRLLRQMSDFRLIFGTICASSRHRCTFLDNPPHSVPPMNLTERMHTHFWGLEWIYFKITA